jgi:peptidoglycan/xylan/chitin deacetylase (PgdA/CDA1 family)
VLTVDVDAESALLQIDPKLARRPSAMAHQAYGARVGVFRLLAELERADVRGTFFVPGYTAERYPDTIRAIAAAGHELGCHGYLHESPALLSGPDEERGIIERSVEIIERLAGTRPRGFRAPMADPSPETPELLAATGFLYDSSLTDDDVPYILETANGPLVELPLHWSMDDWEQYAFLPEPDVGQLIDTPSKVAELWCGELDAAWEEGLLCMGIVHPELSGRPARARVIRQFVEHARELGEIWFATASEVAGAALDANDTERRDGIGLPEPPAA